MADPSPGPWVFHAQGDANEYAMVANDWRWLYVILFNDEIFPPEQMANITLMTAAPDLLAACEAAIRYRSQTHHGGDPCLAILNSAVLKARGGSI